MLIPNTRHVLDDGREVLLRSPAPEDAGAVLAHLRRVFSDAYVNFASYPSFWAQFPIERERQILEDISKAPRGFMISVFFEDKIVGNLGCLPPHGQFFETNGRIGMGVEAGFRKKGLGALLLSTAITWAKLNGMHRLDLSVRSFNHAAISLYEKLGFTRIGTAHQIALIDGRYYDEYLYEKLLAAS